jgi:hypothetical protein
MTKIAAIVLALAAALAATPAGAARDKDAWKAAKPAGEPTNCVQLTRIRETRVRDDRTIDFYMLGGQVLRNTLPQSCPGLGFEERFSYSTSLSQLCAVDIITVLRTGPIGRGASCGLGKFQPVTGAPR